MAFSFGSVAHAMASVANDVVKISKAVTSVLSKVKAEEPIVEELTSLVSPQAVEIERAAFMALGLLAHAAQDTSAATSASGLNLQLDQQSVADFKALGQYLAGEMAKRGIVTK